MVLQFEVETKRFDRFKESFTTDRYFTVTQWEEIVGGLNQRLATVIRNGKSEDKGHFVADNSFRVSFGVADKSASYVNFNNLDFAYKFDWILLVKIVKLASGPEKLEPKAKESSDSDSKSSFLKTRYRTTKENEASMPMKPPLAISPDYGNDKPLSPIAKLRKLPGIRVKTIELSSQSTTDSDQEVVRKADYDQNHRSKRRVATPIRPNPGPRSHKKIKTESNQPTLDRYAMQKTLKMDHPAIGKDKPTGSKEKKASATLNHVSDKASDSNSDAMEQMEKFLENSKLQNVIKLRRMEKLKDTKILTCSSISNDELRKSVQSLNFFIFMNFFSPPQPSA